MRFLWNHKILRSDNDHSHTDHPAEFSIACPEKISGLYILRSIAEDEHVAG